MPLMTWLKLFYESPIIIVFNTIADILYLWRDKAIAEVCLFEDKLILMRNLVTYRQSLTFLLKLCHYGCYLQYPL